MGNSLCVLPPKVSASCIYQETVQNEEEEVDRDSTNDPTQVSSSLFQEDNCHEDNIQVVAINIVEELYLHSMFFSSMSSIMNDEDGFLVGDHSEPSLEHGVFSNESIGLKYGQLEVRK